MSQGHSTRWSPHMAVVKSHVSSTACWVRPWPSQDVLKASDARCEPIAGFTARRAVDPASGWVDFVQGAEAGEHGGQVALVDHAQPLGGAGDCHVEVVQAA